MYPREPVVRRFGAIRDDGEEMENIAARVTLVRSDREVDRAAPAENALSSLEVLGQRVQGDPRTTNRLGTVTAGKCPSRAKEARYRIANACMHIASLSGVRGAYISKGDTRRARPLQREIVC